MIRKFIINFIYRIIRFIEIIEYRNIDLDEDDISKKIISTIDMDEELLVKSDSGFVPVSNIHITQPYRHHDLVLENGLKLSGADNHILFDENFKEVFMGDLKVGDLIKTEFGDSMVKSMKKNGRKTSMGDVTIDHPDHRYYTNGILSHNTICSSIYILHYMLFNNDKNVLIAANKGDTATEILDKSKDIYMGLPFFIQKGISVWNQRVIKFDNNSRAKAFTMTATSSIGQAADLVYLDEFAYIPETLANRFYKSIQPTLVSIENSKMIITSTPNGLNLFHKLLTDAERQEGDPLKNNFASMRVYWYQVPGRNVTYIRLNQFKMASNDIDFESIYDMVKNKYDPYDEVDPNGLPFVSWRKNGDTGEQEIHIQNSEDRTMEDISQLKYENRNGDKLPIGVIGELSSWKLDAIKNIGSLEAFNQEFDLKFINASKSLFPEDTIKRIQSGQKDFKFMAHDVFDRLVWDYSDLKFIDDTSIFNVSQRKKIRGVITVDVSEGLGQDYSVINIFKIDRKDDDLIEEQKEYYQGFQDFFCLKQIGMFRSNLVSVSQLAEILYLLAFEYFDEDRFKIVLEINNHGHAVLESIKNVFNQDNNYGSHIFFRFKHRMDAPKKKIGIKVSGNKKLLVKNYQDRVQDQDVVIYEKTNISELTTFIKQESSNGNITYSADGASKDDTVMTIVNMCEIFNDNIFSDMMDEFKMDLNDSNLNRKIDEILKDIVSKDGTDYETFIETARRMKRIGYKDPNITGQNWTNQIR